jgi:drug/metabolite transporter (DMT)-like permease
MALHQASGNWRLGLGLALLTAACWATLPVALKIALEQVDPFTLTWFRFLVAAGLLLAWLAARGGFAEFVGLTRRQWLRLALAALLLIGNYVFYLLGVARTTPANAQLLIQLAPLLMALGGIFVFREPYRPAQWVGMGIIVLGLWLFFRDQWFATALPPDMDATVSTEHSAATTGSHLTSRSRYLLGSGFVGIAALVWAAYALIQKQLLLRLSSPAILLFIYLAAVLLLLPFSQPAQLRGLDARHWALLAYCALNTVVAYGAFAEALAHWQASRVSAILATTPLLCLASVTGVHALWPTAIAAETVSPLGYAGAVLVVAGSAMSSLLGQRRREEPP